MDDKGEYVSSLSGTQDKVLSLLPIFSGLLSAWGSFQIVRTILGRSRRGDDDDDATTFYVRIARATCYQRIVLGLSCSDFVESFLFPLHAFLLPSELFENSSKGSWAVGNETTCQVLGRAQQVLMVCTKGYSAMLSFVFLFMIRYSIPETKLARVYEPWMHGSTLSFAVLLFVLMCIQAAYGPIPLGHMCYLSEGQTNPLIMLVAGLPVILSVGTVFVNNALIYCHVRKAIRKTRMNPRQLTVDSIKYCRPLGVGPQRNVSEGSKTARSANSSRSIDEVQEIEQDENRELARQRDMQERQIERLRKVANQAFFYVGGYLITQIPTLMLIGGVEFFGWNPSNEAAYFPLLIAQATVLPLQGFINFIIYTRTAYVQELG